MKRGLQAFLPVAALLSLACGGGGGDVPKCVPVPGHCNGLDDDCDSEIDEADEIAADLAALRIAGNYRDARAECTHPNLKGVCGEGVASCIAGVPKCEPLGTPASESDTTCDGYDDNCNGQVDEGVDFAGRDNCGGCGLDAAGAKTIHWCKRDPTGAVAYEECRDGVCVESNCQNGQDDDDDGYIDCGDPDCDGGICSGTMYHCVLTAPGEGTCTCGTGRELCTNGIDDDCDGNVDCADSECLGLACSNADPGMNCGYAPGATRASCLPRETACGNASDDDGDRKLDCADDDCLGLACGSNMNCGTSGGVPACVAIETACANGLDDDGDGAGDCEDGNCIGLACSEIDPDKNCGFEGTLRACVGREAACGNGLDDDGDGTVDCDDPDCDGDACGAGCICTDGIRIETDCGDGQIDRAPIDNDGDGLANCADLEDCLDHSCGTGCLCIQEGGAGRPTELRCGDLLDNDGDNLPDCMDPDCAQQDCSAPGGPACTCDPCPGGVCPTGERACEDAIDNDGDRLVDCADTDCDGLRCLGTDGCICANGRPTEEAGSCGDGVDADQDGTTDCADTDCDGSSCGTGCVCAGLMAVELPDFCGDGSDNDGDGDIDCADADCDGQSCGVGCLCANLLPTETAIACGDGVDNDGDLSTDCADLDCTGDSCGTGCLCVAEGGVGRAAEAICGDRDGTGAIDNDGDGLANCDDPDCAGHNCGTGVGSVEVQDCTCVGAVPTEMDCGNGADDDLDSFTDCEDPDCFDVAPCPLITAVVPADGPGRPAGGACGSAHPRQTIVIQGRHLGVDAQNSFVGTVASVVIGGTGCLNVVAVSSTEITCETPAHEPGTVGVQVTNTGNFTDSLADAFTFTTGQNAGIYSCGTESATMVATAGAQTPMVLGFVAEPGVTEAVPPSNPFLAQVGFGTAGTVAECDPSWKWFPATLDASREPSLYDYYQATFPAPVAGTYAIQYRFSRDGVHWLYCDADTGTAGLQAGTLTVTP